MGEMVTCDTKVRILRGRKVHKDPDKLSSPIKSEGGVDCCFIGGPHAQTVG